MQLIWVSGPVGKIRTITLDRFRLILLLIASSSFLLICGALLHFVGFRIALNFNPSLIRNYSELYSSTENEHIKKIYSLKYQEIQQQLLQNQRLISDLQEQNKKLFDLAVPKALQKEKPALPATGGPFIPFSHNKNQNPEELLEASSENLKIFNLQLQDQKKIIEQQIQWLITRPLTLPLLSSPSLTSGFGGRIDPFTKMWSAHEGLDFQETIGSKIVSSGAGKVRFSGWDPSYGKTILIDHGNGFVSRYAHASQLLVQAGEYVQHQQLIGLVGSTGRSTGPHLHFEIIKNGIAIDPKEYLIGLK